VDDLEQLRRLGELHRTGILTDEEFATKKRALIGDPTDSKPPRRKLGKRVKVVAALIAIVALLGGGGTAMALKAKADGEARDEKKALALKKKHDEEKRVAAAREKERAAEEEADLQQAEDDIEISMRKSIVRSLRSSVTKDFKGRVNDGILDGPILSTSCDPIEGGVDELEEETGKYECLVATEKTGTRMRGYPVDATVNYTKGSYTWQLSS
jgi:hypothetical protein